MINCKDCRSFERGKWHKAVDIKEGEQYGGKCELLQKVLGMSNVDIFFIENFHVMESFGCVLGKNKEE